MNNCNELIPGATLNVYKGFRNGTFRLISPETTLEKIRPYFKNFGITRIANITGLDCIGVPVVTVYRPNSRSLSTSQGKGLSLAAAKASGVMESIELFHGEYIRNPLLFGSYEELYEHHKLVDVSTLASIKGSRYHRELQILWIEGHDLMQNESIWLPFEVVHTNDIVPVPSGSGCFASTSNGLASGNHLLEAILHGISEVIERDATTLWESLSIDTRKKTRIDLKTVNDPACIEVVSRCNDAGIGVQVWETTSNIGVPAFICEIVDQSDNLFRGVNAFTGMGCHPAREIALLRALTEAIQCRLTLISGSRDDLFRSEYQNDSLKQISIGRYASLVDVDHSSSFKNVPTQDAETFDEDIIWSLERLKKVGISRCIVVNLTRPEFGIPVVRVVIPGLEGPDDDPNYIPGPRAAAQQGRRKSR